MTGPATFRLWIGFGEKIFDDTRLASDGNWVDVTDYVRFADFRTSSRRSQFDTFAGGTGQFTLDNQTRLFDPGYSSGTYFGEFKRNTPVRVTAEHSSTRYEVWRGAARKWNPFYKGSFDSITTLYCEDMLGVISAYELPQISAAHDGDTTATRIGRVLDEIGHPSAYRSLGNGGAGGGHSSTTWGENALSHMVQLATVDGGMVYADRDGTITHDNRSAGGILSRQNTSQVTFGHDSEPKYLPEDAGWQGVGDDFRDLVRVQAGAGPIHEIDNSTTNDAPVVFQRLGTSLNSDAQAATAAQFYADLYRTDRMYPATVKVRVATNSEDLRTVLLPRRLRDRATVTHDPPGAGSDLSSDVFIDGISHIVDPTTGDWTASYTFSSADQYDGLDGPPSTWMVLGTETTSELGVGTLGY